MADSLGGRRGVDGVTLDLRRAMAVGVCGLLVVTAAGAGPLTEAVRRGDVAAVRAVLADAVDINAPDGDGTTALHWAVYGDDHAMVEALLAAGARPDVRNDLGVTPLHLAAANASSVVALRLIAGGAPVDAATGAGITPLMEAARVGQLAIVRALLAKGASPSQREPDRGQTALMWAASRRQPDVVKALLEAGADVHARTNVRTVTVMLDRGPGRLAKTAMAHGARVRQGGSTALHFAAQVGDAASAAHLVDAGARIEDRAADGNTALVLAVFSGHGPVARLLLDHGADPNADGAGYTALHAAALRGDAETTRALLAKGADGNRPLRQGSPVRRFASQWALPRTLLGATPLFVAAAYLEADVVRALLAGGADPNRGLASGTTPLLVAAGVDVEKEVRPTDLERWHLVDSDFPEVPTAEADVLETVRALLDGGADANTANRDGTTPLHPVASAGMTQVIQLLADRGAPLRATNNNGKTPLDLAAPRPDGRTPRGLGSAAAEDLLRQLLDARPRQ